MRFPGGSTILPPTTHQCARAADARRGGRGSRGGWRLRARRRPCGSQGFRLARTPRLFGDDGEVVRPLEHPPASPASPCEMLGDRALRSTIPQIPYRGGGPGRGGRRGGCSAGSAGARAGVEGGGHPHVASRAARAVHRRAGLVLPDAHREGGAACTRARPRPAPRRVRDWRPARGRLRSVHERSAGPRRSGAAGRQGPPRALCASAQCRDALELLFRGQVDHVHAGRRRDQGRLHPEPRRPRHALHQGIARQRVRRGHRTAAPDHDVRREVERGLHRRQLGRRADVCAAPRSRIRHDGELRAEAAARGAAGDEVGVQDVGDEPRRRAGGGGDREAACGLPVGKDLARRTAWSATPNG